MAIEPQVFLCYGRPDKDVAYAVAYHFWNNQIECYNYQAKPVEDRLGRELDHRPYIPAPLFVAVLSPQGLGSYFVNEEITRARKYSQISKRFCQCRAYVFATPDPLDNPLSLPPPDLSFSYDRLPHMAEIVSEMIRHMGSAFAERARKAWEINKGLYPGQWAELNSRYAAPPPPLSNLLAPGRNSVFPDDHEPTMEELKALGRERLSRLWSEAAERRDNLRRIYGPTYRPGRQAFLYQNLKCDLELIERAIAELDKKTG